MQLGPRTITVMVWPLLTPRTPVLFATVTYFGDVLDDLRIPVNDVADTQRYRDTVPLMHGIDVVVGHGLGGSVALSLAKAYGIKSVTYGAPVTDLNPFDSQGTSRHRHVGDPVAFFGFSSGHFDLILPQSAQLRVTDGRTAHKSKVSPALYELISRFMGVDFQFNLYPQRYGLSQTIDQELQRIKKCPMPDRLC